MAIILHTTPTKMGRNREEKKRTQPPPKQFFCWRTFLASKKIYPGRWWIQKPYKNQENHIHHRNLSSVDPIFFRQRKVLHWSRAVCAFFFPGERETNGCVFFTYSWGLFTYGSSFFYLRWGNRKQKRPNPIFWTGGTVSKKRPNRFSTVSKKDQTKFQL